MRITALLENTTIDSTLEPKHGLSLYIETAKHKVLFDLGPDETYMQNAQKMGINLAEVDTAVISHGHYDHGGGLAGFLSLNDNARIFLHRKAFEPHYHKVRFSKKYIGLDQKIADSKRFTFVDDTMLIDDELFLFSDIEGQFDTKSHRALLKKTRDGYKRDDFTHELCLIATEGDKSVLFSGCSHRGINNILIAADKHSSAIRAVFGGFHLMNPTTKKSEPVEVVEKLAGELSARNTEYYTCHCTGKSAFETIHGIMGDIVRYLSTGEVVVISSALDRARPEDRRQAD